METVARACSKTVSEGYGFDIPWEIIIQLFDWLMANCFETEDSFLDAADSPTRWQMFGLYWRARQVLRGTYRGRSLRRSAIALTGVVLEAASALPPEKLKAMFQEAA